MFGATMSLHPKVKSPSKTCRSVATRGQLNGLRCRLQQQGSPSPMESPQQGHLQASGPGLQDGNTAFAALQMCQEKCALVLLSMDLYPCSPQQQTSELHPCAGLLQLSYPYAPSELGSFFQSRAQASFFGILCPEIQCSPSQAVSLPPSSAPQPTSKPSRCCSRFSSGRSGAAWATSVQPCQCLVDSLSARSRLGSSKLPAL